MKQYKLSNSKIIIISTIFIIIIDSLSGKLSKKQYYENIFPKEHKSKQYINNSYINSNFSFKNKQNNNSNDTKNKSKSVSQLLVNSNNLDEDMKNILLSNKTKELKGVESFYSYSTIKSRVVPDNDDISNKSTMNNSDIAEIDNLSLEKIKDKNENNMTKEESLIKAFREMQRTNCLCDFLCIQIGRICGDWDFKLKSSIVKEEIPVNGDKIIKPILIIDNSKKDEIKKEDKPNNGVNVIITDNDDDCDLLKIRGIAFSSSLFPTNFITNVQSITNLKNAKSSLNEEFTNTNKQDNSSNINNNNDKDIFSTFSTMRFIANSSKMYLSKKNNTTNKSNLDSLTPIDISEVAKSSIENSKNTEKFYRKINYGGESLTSDTFKEGINIIVLERKNNYKKVFDKTYNIKTSSRLADKLACKISEQEYDKIIILTAIGNWLSGVTPKLIKEVKKIGGPDLAKLLFLTTNNYEKNDNTNINSINSDKNKEFIFDRTYKSVYVELALIGRKGLCENNGQFKIVSNTDFDINKLLIQNLPSECLGFYSKSLDCSSLASKNNKSCFFNSTDIDFSLKLKTDNRFSSIFPTIISINPPIRKVDIKHEVDVKIQLLSLGSIVSYSKIVFYDKKYKLYCNDIISLSETVVSCKIDLRLYPEIPNDYELNGNAVIEIIDKNTKYHLRSPRYTCPMFSFKKIKVEKEVRVIKQIEKQVIIKETICCRKDMPCCPYIKPIMIMNKQKNRVISNMYDKLIKRDVN